MRKKYENDAQKRVELNRRHREWRKKNHTQRLVKERARHKKLQETNEAYREVKKKNAMSWREHHKAEYQAYQKEYYQSLKH